MPDYFRCPKCNKKGLYYIGRDKLECKYCKASQEERRKADRREK